jgi:uncharacterized protein YndB with AHSA1/START domain
LEKDIEDRIEKQVLLRAPRARVWRALTDPQQLGRWFASNPDIVGTVTLGGRLRAQVRYPGAEHATLEITIERLEPEQLLAWRWHPGAKPGVDTSGEPCTTVTFTLREAPEGTWLTVVESGFDLLTVERRAAAFRSNNAGWAQILLMMERDVVAPE